MKLGARDLRIKAARVLEEVRQGRPVTITYRNQAVAIIKPLPSGKRSRAFEPIGFGIWTGRKDLGDLAGWVRKIRRPRFAR